MRVLVLKDSVLNPKEISGELESLQVEVNGYIEIPFICETLRDNNIDLIINEEGKFDGSNPEIVIANKDGSIVDIIFGNCVFTSHNNDGDTIGLTLYQQNVVHDLIKEKNYIIYNDKIFKVRVIRV